MSMSIYDTPLGNTTDDDKMETEADRDIYGESEGGLDGETGGYHSTHGSGGGEGGEMETEEGDDVEGTENGAESQDYEDSI